MTISKLCQSCGNFYVEDLGCKTFECKAICLKGYPIFESQNCLGYVCWLESCLYGNEGLPVGSNEKKNKR